MELVSIITPAFNCKATIVETYESVASQTYASWEWIVVDDCSTDGSFEYLEGLAAKDSRICVLRTPKNSGTAVARNRALKKARGRYISFLDSDDLLDNNYLEEQVAFIQDNGPVISAGYRRKAKNSCTDFYVPDVVDYKKALKGNDLSCLTTMYDKEALGEVFFPENIDRPEDYVFWLAILRRGIVARGNHKILATYLIRPGSRSSNKLKLVKHMFRVYHKTQGINWFKSWFHVFRWAIYGIRKYRGVR